MTDVCAHLDAVRALALEAGRRILDVYERGEDTVEVTEKPDGSPLTEADHAAQAVITSGLAKLTPKIPLLSEELVPADSAARANWKLFWLVDPLDGTKEFVSRNGEFTVNIALIENGRPVLGVVYVPVTGVTYYACRGQGAFKQKGACEVIPVKVRDLSGKKPIVAASRSHSGAELPAFLSRLGPHDAVNMGSSLKFCLVAEGTADIYPRLGPTMEWDTAAAQCIVEEAGGQVIDRAGNALRYNKPDLHNPWFIAAAAPARDWLEFFPPAST